MIWPFAGRRERLRREASDWIARLNGPDRARHREAFERWYEQSPDHAEAYDRLAALFLAAGAVERRESLEAQPRPDHGRARFAPGRYAVAAALSCAALVAFLLLSGRTMGPPLEAQQQFATFAVDQQAEMQIELRDGSRLLLARGSRVEVAIGASERRLRLVAGGGRFTVAAEERPFIVSAAEAEIVARGTQFEVNLDGGRAIVALIEGRVDVSYPPSDGTGQRRLASLVAGQRLVIESTATGSAMGSAPVTAEARSSSMPSAMLELDDVPLAAAVARDGHGRIRLGDPSLAGLRVTGAFRAGDSEEFARALAAAFDLEVDRAPDGALVLMRGEGGSPAR